MVRRSGTAFRAGLDLELSMSYLCGSQYGVSRVYALMGFAEVDLDLAPVHTHPTSVAHSQPPATAPQSPHHSTQVAAERRGRQLSHSVPHPLSFLSLHTTAPPAPPTAPRRRPSLLSMNRTLRLSPSRRSCVPSSASSQTRPTSSLRPALSPTGPSLGPVLAPLSTCIRWPSFPHCPRIPLPSSLLFTPHSLPPLHHHRHLPPAPQPPGPPPSPAYATIYTGAHAPLEQLTLPKLATLPHTLRALHTMGEGRCSMAAPMLALRRLPVAHITDRCRAAIDAERVRLDQLMATEWSEEQLVRLVLKTWRMGGVDQAGACTSYEALRDLLIDPTHNRTYLEPSRLYLAANAYQVGMFRHPVEPTGGCQPHHLPPHPSHVDEAHRRVVRQPALRGC